MRFCRPHSRRGATRFHPGSLTLVLSLAALLLLPGCGGCRRTPNDADAAKQIKSAAEKEAERKRLEAERIKPDFEIGSSATLPPDPDRIQLFTKPGHWMAAQAELIANHYDFAGRLKVGDIDLGATNRFRLGLSRDVALAKGQKKNLEFRFYLPAGPEIKQLPMSLASTSGRDVLGSRDPVTRLFSHQYYLAVLAREPDTFVFVRRLDTLRAPTGKYFMFNEPADPHFRLAIVGPGATAALPSHSSAWTSVACLLWDDFDPKPLTSAQQQALLDWLHWGGQLVVSGPQTIDLLKASFLADYLPADGSGAVELTEAQLAEIDNAFSPPTGKLRLPAPLTGERLAPRPGAQITEGDDALPLVVERSVGSGRVVVTAFRLNERALARWPGFDSFLNCCLLRRPGRKFARAERAVALDWRDGHSWFDPRRVSRVRYFSRDAGVWTPWNQFGLAQAPVDQSLDHLRRMAANRFVTGASPGEGNPIDPAQPGFGPGVAGWSDFGEVSQRAQAQLQREAGIKIPTADFVVRVLGVYLLVLIPVNFALFRLLGRVEWAWLAVPVISLGGALAVVYLAQLDIGFVRSQNELAIVELQGAHPRAHVSRYTALYTSLSTRYAAEFDDTGAVALPLPTSDETLLPGQTRSTITLAADQTARLNDFRVASNSIGMLHSEHMLPLAGGLILEPVRGGAPDALQVRNATGLALRDVRVVHRALDGGGDRYGAGDNVHSGSARIATVDKLAPGDARELSFAPLPPRPAKPKPVDPLPSEEEEDPFVDESEAEDSTNDIAARALAAAQADPDALASLAVEDCVNGEYRLVAWSDSTLAGMAIEPRATQTQQLALIVAHLRFDAAGLELARDSSSRRQVELEIGRAPEDPDVIDFGKPESDDAPGDAAAPADATDPATAPSSPSAVP
jgi:hypothetical protein